MKYNLRCLICRGFKDCISKYIFVIVFSALLLVIARHTTVPVQNILINNSDYLQKARKNGHFTGYKN